MYLRFNILTWLMAIICLAVSVFPSWSRKNDLEAAIERIIKDKDAEVGVAVMENGKILAAVNDRRRYPMMSVMKMHQALWVTDSLCRAGLGLGTIIEVYENELKKDTYSPLRDSLACMGDKGPYSLDIKTLLRYTLQMSDNNACDILFSRFGGPGAVDRYIRSLDIDGFAIQVTEAQMHDLPALCRKNWSRPSSAARILDRMTCGSLGNCMLEHVLRTMAECGTGKARLAAPLLGRDAVIGHKTGTGDKDPKGRITGINDIGFVYLPDGRHYTIAVFITDSWLPAEQTEEIIAEISEAVYMKVSTASPGGSGLSIVTD